MNLTRKILATLVFAFGIAGFAAAPKVDAPAQRGVPDSGDNVPDPEHLSASLVLTAPTFVDEDDVWIDENNFLHVLLPNPNSDGLDPSGDVNFRWLIRIMQGCDEIYKTTISTSDYPYLWRLRFPLYLDDYQVHVARQSTLGKREVSQGTVIVGPTGGASAISGDFLEIDRWLLHIPKQSGGFRGDIIFNNRFPALPAKVWVAGFDAQGQVIQGTQKPVQIIGLRPVAKIYGDVGNGAIFDMGRLDQISHIGIFEENNRKLVDISITYQSIEDDSLAATVTESKMDSGSALGKSFAMEARQSTAYWDGVALTNLASLDAVRVDAVLRSLEDGSELARVDLGEVESGEKQLFVISDLLPYDPDAYYTLEQSSAKGNFQVLGLRGSQTQDPALLVGSLVNKVQ